MDVQEGGALESCSYSPKRHSSLSVCPRVQEGAGFTLPVAAALLSPQQLPAERHEAQQAEQEPRGLCWLRWLAISVLSLLISLGPNLKTSARARAVASLPVCSLLDWMLFESQAYCHLRL